MKTLTCLLLDDERGPRERLAVLLSKLEDVKVIGIEEKPETAIEAIIKKKPEIVFIDVEMPRMTDFEVVKEVRKARPGQDFIFVTGYNQYAIKAIKNEAFDFLLKPVDIDELKETIERYKERLLTKPKETSCQNSDILKCLTEREMEVLTLIGQHKTAGQIAEELHISKHTVDTHRKNILEKTGLHKTSELVVFARENGLV
ncbi:MAG: response regulator transcription factor [Bacteroidales bacterium]|nr:response regulator transcription factor [Bacteroidales bacterium]